LIVDLKSLRQRRSPSSGDHRWRDAVLFQALAVAEDSPKRAVSDEFFSQVAACGRRNTEDVTYQRRLGQRARPKDDSMRILQAAVLSAFIVGGVAIGVNAFATHARKEALKSDKADVEAIAWAMLSYREKHGRLPPAILYGPGDTPYSWRVALLPELGLQELYDDYRRNEPWDSPHNKALVARMPDVYRSATAPADSTTTAYFVPTGPTTAFATSDGLSDPEITDPWDSLVTVVSGRRDIPWTSPEDIAFDDYAPPPELGGFHEKFFHIAFANGTARSLPNPFPDARLMMQMINACDGYPHDCEF